MLSRRDLVSRLATGAAAACVVGVARSGAAAVRREPPRASGSGAAAAEVEPSEPIAASAPPGRAPAVIPPQPAGIVDSGPPTTQSAPVPWALVRPLAVGATLGQGWRLAALSGVANGSCVLTLQNERGRTHRIHVCRNDGRPRGLVYTERCDLVVMNGGQGDLPTEESLAQAVAQVAHVLARNESDRRQAPVVTALLSHAERVERFAGAAALR
jgi:hypothetical protein